MNVSVPCPCCFWFFHVPLYSSPLFIFVGSETVPDSAFPAAEVHVAVGVDESAPAVVPVEEVSSGDGEVLVVLPLSFVDGAVRGDGDAETLLHACGFETTSYRFSIHLFYGLNKPRGI